MPFVARLDPINNIAVAPQMYGGLAARHDDPRLLPKRLAKRLRLGRVVARREMGMFREWLGLYRKGAGASF
jgi:hypothetical protein